MLMILSIIPNIHTIYDQFATVQLCHPQQGGYQGRLPCSCSSNYPNLFATIYNASVHYFQYFQLTYSPMLTETLRSTSGSSGRYLKLTPSILMSPFSGQLCLPPPSSTLAGASCGRQVYWKFLSRELM